MDLGDYPRLRRHIEAHGAALKARHVAWKQPARWYRTIDLVRHELTARPKLLFPDIKASIHPVLDPGGLYPHHNLYWITSAVWDIEVLGGLLLSDIANLFVGTYCVKMAGGCYRFEAQYLRRIRVPRPGGVLPSERRALAEAFGERDVERASGVARRLYGVEWAGTGAPGEVPPS